MYCSEQLNDCWSCQATLATRKRDRTNQGLPDPLLATKKEPEPHIPPTTSEWGEEDPDATINWDKDPFEEANTTKEPTDNCIKLKGQTKGKEVTILVDSGATNSYISSQMVKNLQAKTSPMKESTVVTFGNGKTQTLSKICENLLVRIGDYKEYMNLTVVDLPGHDIIFGKN